MPVTLEEVKEYLRIDSDEEDGLVAGLLLNVENLCKDAARVDTLEEFWELGPPVKLAVLYGVSYLYEHREDADYHQLLIMLRSLLFGVRKEGF